MLCLLYGIGGAAMFADSFRRTVGPMARRLLHHPPPSYLMPRALVTFTAAAVPLTALSAVAGVVWPITLAVIGYNIRKTKKEAAAAAKDKKDGSPSDDVHVC